MDLVEVSPTAEPPVCRVMDFGKYLFEQNKKQQIARKKQKQIQVKEVKFRPTTDEGDYQIKLRNLTRFLTEGDKAKVTVGSAAGRCCIRNLGAEILERIKNDLEEVGSGGAVPPTRGQADGDDAIGPRRNKFPAPRGSMNKSGMVRRSTLGNTSTPR